MTTPGWEPPRAARLAMPVALAVVVVLTATVAGLRSLSYAYEAPGLQVVLNTADAVIALVVAYLVHGRYRQHGRIRDLLLASGLVVLAVANLPVTALAQALSVDDRELYHWLALLVRTLAAALFAAAAVTPRTARVDRRTPRGGRAAGVQRGGQQHHHRHRQAHGEPAQRGQDDEPAGRGTDGQRGSHGVRGKPAVKTFTGRVPGRGSCVRAAQLSRTASSSSSTCRVSAGVSRRT